MKTTSLLAVGAIFAAAAACAPTNGAPLSHSGAAVAQEDGLIETARHRGWRHKWRGHRHGWYGPRHYRHHRHYSRRYWRSPYYASPGFGIYFGTRPYYW